MWAFEHADIVPDVICVAKALANACPIGRDRNPPRAPGAMGRWGTWNHLRRQPRELRRRDRRHADDRGGGPGGQCSRTRRRAARCPDGTHGRRQSNRRRSRPRPDGRRRSWSKIVPLAIRRRDLRGADRCLCGPGAAHPQLRHAPQRDQVPAPIDVTTAEVAGAWSCSGRGCARCHSPRPSVAPGAH